MSKANHGTVSQVDFIRANQRMLAQLPDPEAEWTAGDIDIHSSTLYAMGQLNIIEVVGRERHVEQKRTRQVYRTKRQAFDEIQKCRERAHSNRLLPCKDEACPSSGFTNPRDEDGLVCKDCGEVHDPDEVPR